MKINFGLLGLAVAQSGDDRWEDTSYDYDISSDRWSNENQYSLDEANAGITFGVMSRVTKQQEAKHFQKALKLSCWNSNMIRDMNNDNKFSVYYNDQVEHKRFHPGISSGGSPVGGTVDTRTGADDLSWLYAVGDLRTGYNHQYGFEHNTATTKFSDPLLSIDANEVNRLGAGSGGKTLSGRNDNRLRQMDEYGQNQPLVDNSAIAASLTLTKGNTRLVSDSSILVSDQYHSVRPDNKWTFRKWGYQSDNVERAASNGYADDNVVYHFGHHDNKDNLSNRPNMRYGASNDATLALESSTTNTNDAKNKGNMSKFEFDFHGFKDDWRYSLRMGGCLYEAARWVYDESSFHRTGRLTYTDDTLFMDDPFNPRDGTDIFGAHEFAAHTGGATHAALAQAITDTTASTAAEAAKWTSTNTCYAGLTALSTTAADTCRDTTVPAFIAAYKALVDQMYAPANRGKCTLAASVSLTDAETACLTSLTSYTGFKSARDAVLNSAGTSGCLIQSSSLVGGCTDSSATPVRNNALYPGLDVSYGEAAGLLALWTSAVDAQAAATADATYASEFTIDGHESDLFANGSPSGWNNAGSTNNDASTDYSHGNCISTSSCESMNVATPSSGGVFADVHWVHVFNAHIFPLQDVGYYQYDQTMGIDNINPNNDSITSRDGYGYNIYTSNVTGKLHVMRDVWGSNNSATYIDTTNNYSYNQGLSSSLATAKAAYNTAYYTTWAGSACATAATAECQGFVLTLSEAYKEFHRCAAVNASVCDLASTTACFSSAAHPCYLDHQRLTTAAAAVWTHDDTSAYSGCLATLVTAGTCPEQDTSADIPYTDSLAENATIFKAKIASADKEHPKDVATLLDAAAAVGAAQAAVDLRIPAHQFHSQYGTLNIGNLDGHGSTYTAADRPDTTSTDDFYPILTKTRRKIEDFNVVMANPTYEGHGFLNFVATYHDHTENFDDSSNAWIRQVGKRFLSTIGGLTTASNQQRNVCRALKDGIDSYRINGYMPATEGTGLGTGGHNNHGHDDPYLGPLGPGPAGDYGNGQRCGAAMYENFGDWFLRPAQTYAAYNKFTDMFGPTGGNTGTDSLGTNGWATQNCQDNSSGDALGDYCLTNLESYNYWAFILSEDYNPILGDGDASAWTYQSPHELWRNGSMHYDRRGQAGLSRKRRQAPVNTRVGVPRSSGRGFAISSFPANELGKDFRFNIRTLHNMGNGVAKQYYQIMNLRGHDGNDNTNDPNLSTSNLRTSETVWSYYFYAVDTIKIAFPEFVARVNHCDNHLHRGDSHCLTQNTMPVDNGGPDGTDASSDPNGINALSAYPGYAEGYPHNRLGFQEIIIDGVTMKKTDNQYDSRVTNSERTSSSGNGNWHKQYHNARGLRQDDHTRATLLYADTEFANEDLSLHESNAAMCGDDMLNFNMGTAFKFFGGDGSTRKDVAGESAHFQGYSDSYQPLKPCASWCALDQFVDNVVTGDGIDNSKQTLEGSKFGDTDGDRLASRVQPTNNNFSKYGGICGRVLRIDGLLQTYDELHNRQYGTLQEIWVQLQYAYQESIDDADRKTTQGSVNRVQSPFPNVFFSAPEVVDIRGFCPSSNMKCRGYMSDQHQPYGGSRSHVERVHWNASATRFSAHANGFGANQLKDGGIGSGWGAKQSGNDWTLNRDFRGDSKWPWNYHAYTASSGTSYGSGATGTTYSSRDENHTVYA